MKNNINFRNLITSIYGSIYDGKILVASLLGLSNKTIENYLNDKNRCPNSVVSSLELERIRKNTIKVCDFHNHTNDWSKTYARIKSGSTYSDCRKLKSYFYHRMHTIDKIILFSIDKSGKDLNDHIFGCAFISSDELILLDNSSMTAQRRARSIEIESFIKQIYINDFLDKTYIIDEKLPRLDTLDSKQALDVVLNHKKSLLTSENIVEFYNSIAGHTYFDPSGFIGDSGNISMIHIIKKISIEFKVEYQTSEYTYTIDCSSNDIMNILEKLIFDISNNLDISESIDDSDSSYNFIKEYPNEIVTFKVTRKGSGIIVKRLIEDCEKWNARYFKKIVEQL